MLVSILKPDFQFTNDNGSLVQLVHDGWKQFNVITSKKNSFRGGHFHKINKEAFYIISGKLSLELIYNGEKETNIFEEGDMFVISPFLLHSFMFLEDTIMISMYSIGVEIEDGSKDIYSN